MKVKVGDLVHENYIAKYIKKSLCLIIRVNVSDSPVHPRLDLLLKQYLIVKLIIFIAKN